jgi:peroxiredoxin
MTIKVGDRIPETTLTQMGEEGPQPVSTSKYFGGKTVVLFSVPGAFTPTCSARHLPGYVDNLEKIKARGVDAVACTAVNDIFVMDAWGKSANAEGIDMLADGNAEFAKALGLELDASGFGMGTRGQRFALVADDGVITGLFIEGPGEFKVSSAEHVLSQL